MKRLIFLCLALLSFSFQLKAQSVSKEDIIGTYEYTMGDPAEKNLSSDSTYLSLSYMEFTKTTYELKKNGSLIIIGYRDKGKVIIYKEKGKWKIENDRVKFIYKNETEVYRYQEPAYLLQIDGNKGLFKL